MVSLNLRASYIYLFIQIIAFFLFHVISIFCIYQRVLSKDGMTFVRRFI